MEESGSAGIVTSVVVGEEMTTEEKLKEVLLDLEKRRVNDDMMFARLREELDFIANTKKEDRVMVTGSATGK
jgi:phosphotransacetylase